MRFPEFQGEWVEKKLGEVATNKSGKYNPKGQVKFVKCIELEHIIGEAGQLTGFVDGSQSESIKNIFSTGDVLFGKLRPYLKKYLLAPFDGVCSSEIWVLKGKGISNDYLYRIIQTEAFIDLAKQSSGSKMPRADWNIVERGIFYIPAPPEQQKISTFLSLIDQRIETQRKIISQLETLMKSLIEKIFSQQLRFPEFEQEWERYNLSDLLTFFPTNSLSWEQLEYKVGGLYNLHYGLIHQGMPTLIDVANNVLPSIKIESIPGSYVLCKDGDVAFTDASEDTNDVAKVVEFINCWEKEIVCGLHTIHARDKLNVTVKGFKGFAFKATIFRQQIQKLAQGTKVFSISSLMLGKCFVDIPEEGEQSVIVQCLFRLEEKIQIEKNILSQYQKQKKFLMNRLFI